MLLNVREAPPSCQHRERPPVLFCSFTYQYRPPPTVELKRLWMGATGKFVPIAHPEDGIVIILRRERKRKFRALHIVEIILAISLFLLCSVVSVLYSTALSVTNPLSKNASMTAESLVQIPVRILC
jgi:hypothetical protein